MVRALIGKGLCRLGTHWVDIWTYRQKALTCTQIGVCQRCGSLDYSKKSAARSPVITAVALVERRTTWGQMEVSTTRRPSTPRTRQN